MKRNNAARTRVLLSFSSLLHKFPFFIFAGVRKKERDTSFVCLLRPSAKWMLFWGGRRAHTHEQYTDIHTSTYYYPRKGLLQRNRWHHIIQSLLFLLFPPPPPLITWGGRKSVCKKRGGVSGLKRHLSKVWEEKEQEERCYNSADSFLWHDEIESDLCVLKQHTNRYGILLLWRLWTFHLPPINRKGEPM